MIYMQLRTGPSYWVGPLGRLSGPLGPNLVHLVHLVQIFRIEPLRRPGWHVTRAHMGLERCRKKPEIVGSQKFQTRRYSGANSPSALAGMRLGPYGP